MFEIMKGEIYFSIVGNIIAYSYIDSTYETKIID